MSDGSSTPYLVVETGSHEGQRINLTGAHLTVLSMRKEGEVDTVIQLLRQEVGKGSCDAFLVSAWAHYAQTDLQRKLSKLARGVLRADVAPNSAGEADVDVRFDLAAGRMTALVRQRVVPPPGSGNVTDGDVAGHPWMPISFQRAI